MQKNKRFELVLFYTYVALLTSTGLMLLTGMIWSSLKTTGSPMLIGLLLSISVLLPFLTKKLIYRRQARPKTVKNMAFQLILIYVLILLSSVFLTHYQLLNLIICGILLGLSSFITNSTLEKHNTVIAMSGQISYELAARLMQTMVQIGACLGSFLGGVLIYYLNIFSFTQVISLISLLITISLCLFWKTEDTHSVARKDSASQTHIAQANKYIAFPLIALSVGVGMIGFHISSFNVLMPVIFQKIYLWNAIYLGAASAAAGVGSFCASLIKNNSKIVIFFAATLAVCDWVVGLSGNLIMVMAACVLIGFSMNYCRIALRQKLMRLAKNANEAEKIASFSTAIYMCFQGTSPVVVALMLLLFSGKDVFASYLFGFIGILVMLMIIFSISPKTSLFGLYKNTKGVINA